MQHRRKLIYTVTSKLGYFVIAFLDIEMVAALMLIPFIFNEAAGTLYVLDKEVRIFANASFYCNSGPQGQQVQYPGAVTWDYQMT